jgi:hypothetical protein
MPFLAYRRTNLYLPAVGRLTYLFQKEKVSLCPSLLKEKGPGITKRTLLSFFSTGEGKVIPGSTMSRL